MNYHALGVEAVIDALDTTREGLTQDEVDRRLVQYGENQLPEKKKRPLIFQFLKQFNNTLVYILLVAAAISFIFENEIDAYVIVAVIVVDAVIGFVQELRAEHAMEALKNLVVAQSTVIRGGQLTRIHAHDLVPGDLLVLHEGDKVPADARLIREENLKALEASLTGESVPIDKHVQILPEKTALADRANMIWMGTMIAGGSAQALVTHTGENTIIGTIAHAVAAIKDKKTHFQKRTRELAWMMSGLAVLGAIITLAVGIFLRHLPFIEIFLFSIASLVSSIPEGLPAVLTIVLAFGAFRMARAKAIIRYLPSTETLSVVTVIATDKTGTLTENSMTVRRIMLGTGESFEVTGHGWAPDGEFQKDDEAIVPLDHPQLSSLLHLATLGAAAQVVRRGETFEIIGDPTEAALTVLGEKAGLSTPILTNLTPIIHELPFDHDQRYRARLIGHEHHKKIVVIGAFERILELSSKVINGKIEAENLSQTAREAFVNQGDGMANEALRVLGIAYAEASTKTEFISHDDIKNLTFVGLVGMIDPPRPEVPAAIAAAKRAGIRVIMKTGDHKATALAIAREVGIIDEKSNQTALTENDLAELSDEAFSQAVRTHAVFARVTPQTKLRITAALQAQGEVVAVTGDGVNDAPALRQADIGIAMGRIGTDVAREASDMILEDDNFATIVKAIEEGRTVFRNTQQTSFYLATTNLAETATILGAMFLGLPLPLLPIQLLWMNIITDGLTDVALASEPKHQSILLQPPRRQNERILSKEMLPFLALMVIIMFLGTIGLFTYALPQGLDKARTLAFAFMAWAQLWNMWNMRALKDSLFRIGINTNPFVTITFIVSIAVQFIIIGTPWFQTLFHFAYLNVTEWVIIIGLSSSVLWFGELYKLLRFKKSSSVAI